jgi:hypothetical protein
MEVWTDVVTRQKPSNLPIVPRNGELPSSPDEAASKMLPVDKAIVTFHLLKTSLPYLIKLGKMGGITSLDLFCLPQIQPLG